MYHRQEGWRLLRQLTGSPQMEVVQGIPRMVHQKHACQRVQVELCDDRLADGHLLCPDCARHRSNSREGQLDGHACEAYLGVDVVQVYAMLMTDT